MRQGLRFFSTKFFRNGTTALSLLGVAYFASANRSDSAQSKPFSTSHKGQTIVRVQLHDYLGGLKTLVEQGYSVAGVSYPEKIVDVFADMRGKNAILKTL